MSIISKCGFLLFFLKIAVGQDSIQPSATKNDYCMVKEAHGSAMMNFSVLMKHENKDMILRLADREDYFRINFCKPLVEPCKNGYGYSICFRQGDGVEIGLGKHPPIVNAETGIVVFRYTGDECNSMNNYTVTFEMSCDKDVVNSAYIDFDNLYTPTQCDLLMALSTPAACASTEKYSCSFQDESGFYNLFHLARQSGNYLAHMKENLTAILNVCRGIDMDEKLMDCDHKTAICLRDDSDKSKVRYLSMGRIDTETSIRRVNGNLQISFSNGSSCNTTNVDNEDVNETMTSTITFVCDLNAMKGVPFYTGGLEPCQFNFIWATAAACSETLLKSQSLSTAKPCKIEDPIDHFVYDLTIFKGAVFKSKLLRGEYDVSVCGALEQKRCVSGTGVCKLVTGELYGISGGLANENLTWTGDSITLNYTDGSECENGQKEFTTIIFTCDSQDVFTVEEKPCSKILFWSTEIICKKSCMLGDIDFRQLKERKGYYVMKGANSTFVLSVCHGMVHASNFKCPHGAGICKLGENGNNGVLLGYADENLRIVNDDEVILKYLGGPVCDEDNTMRVSSQISFLCDLDVKMGHPTYAGYANCVYHFEWKTRLACRKNVVIMFKNGTAISTYEYKWDLSIMCNHFSAMSNNKNQLKLYSLNLCGQDRCSGYGICDDKVIYGNKTLITYDNIERTMVFQYTYGSRCSDGTHARSVLVIICNETGGIGEPVVAIEEYCFVELEWTTNLTCNGILLSNLHYYNQDLSLTVMLVFSVIGIVFITGIGCYRLRKKDTRTTVLNHVYVCLFQCFYSIRNYAEQNFTLIR